LSFLFLLVKSKDKITIRLGEFNFKFTKTPRSVITNKWGLTDQELADKHVFFMSDGSYLDQLMALVAKGS